MAAASGMTNSSRVQIAKPEIAAIVDSEPKAPSARCGNCDSQVLKRTEKTAMPGFQAPLPPGTEG
jgi:hypothetical protein